MHYPRINTVHLLIKLHKADKGMDACVEGLHEYLDECTSSKRKLTTQHTNESDQESEHTNESEQEFKSQKRREE